MPIFIFFQCQKMRYILRMAIKCKITNDLIATFFERLTRRMKIRQRMTYRVDCSNTLIVQFSSFFRETKISQTLQCTYTYSDIHNSCITILHYVLVNIKLFTFYFYFKAILNKLLLLDILGILIQKIYARFYIWASISESLLGALLDLFIILKKRQTKKQQQNPTNHRFVSLIFTMFPLGKKGSLKYLKKKNIHKLTSIL